MPVRKQASIARRPCAPRSEEIAPDVSTGVIRNSRSQLRLNEAEFKVCLLDCLSVWTSNIILSLPEDCDESTAWAAVQAEIDALLDVVQNHANLSWIFVSNETGMGVVPAYPLGRLYRDVLGRANQYMAAYAGSVYWMAAGIPVKIK
jgi:adenosylcobinamide kinase/adenosylcobinamide-phosphate guanylyltransferase